MTRKDYELIAAALRETRETARKDLHPQAEAMWEKVCEDIAHHLHCDNPRFNDERFMAACGVQS